MNLLRRLRIVVAVAVITLLTLLFLDFTGTLHGALSWLASVQLIPALLALHFAVVVVLLLLTLLFGRLYCSVICPLGIFQDVISRFASLRDKRRKFSYSKPLTYLRWGVVAIFCGAFVAGFGSLVALLDPYSAYGRMAANLFAPIYRWGNNLLAYFAERADSYAFYSVDVAWMGLGTAVVAIFTFALIVVLAWRGGRSYCNTICPVGTVLGAISRFSLYKITIDHQKCNGCRKCVRECKSGCITPEDRQIDYSRCVACFDCIDSCKQGAVSFRRRTSAKEVKPTDVDSSKRNMLAVSATLIASSALGAKEKLVDGGLAVIEKRQLPQRATRIVPAGALSIRNFEKHCVGCQLCVSACPSQVLRPSTDLKTFMQPELSYDKGYCRPECTTCSDVCPAGAIEPIDRAEKSSIQIGHAVLIEKNCVVLTDGVECGNCARHCPVGAITMVEADDKKKYGKRKIPVVNSAVCIGCGACEHLCPARPFSAIYVEGHAIHHTK